MSSINKDIKYEDDTCYEIIPFLTTDNKLVIIDRDDFIDDSQIIDSQYFDNIEIENNSVIIHTLYSSLLISKNNNNFELIDIRENKRIPIEIENICLNIKRQNL